MTNRLQLDFSLSTDVERAEFLNKYLTQEQFVKHPPTQAELDTMANYVLWGKDPSTGLNAKQAGLVDIDTKHSTWSKDNTVDSLDGLLENPMFNENAVRPLNSIPTKIKREVFSRKETLAQCPDYLRPTFVDLFQRIDHIDLAINYYDLAHNKRVNPPRPELLAAFTPEELTSIEQEALSWNQYHYLKMRHLLVDLRQEQYTLRDGYRHQILPAESSCTLVAADPDWDAEIEVLPLGLVGGEGASVFGTWPTVIPANYSEKELQQISDYYWKKKNYAPAANQFWFDFRELEHVYQLFNMYFDMKDAIDDSQLSSKMRLFLETLDFYIDQANLSDLQKDILKMKVAKMRNDDIAIAVNKQYHKRYTPNYISTIFRQRIIPKINNAAAYHERVVGHLFFEEDFKKCNDCGKTFLICPENFTRKSRAKDGFTNRCKACEKKARNK